MTKGDLDGWLIWGRPAKPAAAGVAVLMFTLVVYNVTDSGVFGSLPLGDVVAALAGVSFILLLAGWFRNRQGLVEAGLLFGSISYILRGAFVFFAFGISAEAFWESVGCAIITGGAYLLEAWDHIPKRRLRREAG